MPISVQNISIIDLDVEAIVNAANKSLLGGGGVDGVIHRAAGPGLLEECRLLNGCKTGEAKITKGYKLNAKFVIHTVGPIWRDSQIGEDQMLAQCHTSCLELAVAHNIKNIAFPAISTGAYSYPLREAADVSVGAVFDFLKDHNNLNVIFAVMGRKAEKAFTVALKSANVSK